MKDKSQVVDEFNEVVNMTAKELEKWLKSDDSRSAGWPKDDDSGESVGHDSGRKIVEILESNPDKDPEKYTEEQIKHMRKVVSYCKRHLAQEEKTNDEKSVDEVKETKSYASLKNWGHDPIKKREGKAEVEEDAVEDEAPEEAAEETKAGEKRKAPDDQSGGKKKRETENGHSDTGNKKDGDQAKKPSSTNGKAEREEEEEEEEETNGRGDTKGLEKGDTVSWNWGNGQPEGKVKDVKAGEATIETKNGNEVSRKGNKDDPVVIIDTGKSDAIKLSHELNETE